MIKQSKTLACSSQWGSLNHRLFLINPQTSTFLCSSHRETDTAGDQQSFSSCSIPLVGQRLLFGFLRVRIPFSRMVLFGLPQHFRRTEVCRGSLSSSAWLMPLGYLTTRAPVLRNPGTCQNKGPPSGHGLFGVNKGLMRFGWFGWLGVSE